MIFYKDNLSRDMTKVRVEKHEGGRSSYETDGEAWMMRLCSTIASHINSNIDISVTQVSPSYATLEFFVIGRRYSILIEAAKRHNQLVMFAGMPDHDRPVELTLFVDGDDTGTYLWDAGTPCSINNVFSLLEIFKRAGIERFIDYGAIV